MRDEIWVKTNILFFKVGKRTVTPQGKDIKLSALTIKCKLENTEQKWLKLAITKDHKGKMGFHISHAQSLLLSRDAIWTSVWKTRTFMWPIPTPNTTPTFAYNPSNTTAAFLHRQTDREIPLPDPKCALYLEALDLHCFSFINVPLRKECVPPCSQG